MSRRDEARAELIRAGLELAENTPFHDLTVEEIARAGGLSRSAFYVHFRDKHDLLRAALEQIEAELGSLAVGWWGGEEAPAEAVGAALGALVAAYAEYALVLRIATEASTYDEQIDAAWGRIVGRFIERARERIRTEQHAGRVPDRLDPDATAEALVWMAERCAYVYLGRGERSPEEVVEQLASTWIAALYPGVTPAGELSPDRPGDPIYGVPAPDFARRSPGAAGLDRGTGTRRRVSR